MTARSWKVAVIVIAILIVFLGQFVENFHTDTISGQTASSSGNNSNGTLIVIEGLPSYYIKIHATFQYSGQQNGPATIFLPNGTAYTVNSTNQVVDFSIQINGKPGSTLDSQYTTGIGVNITQQDPINGRMYTNISYSSFKSGAFSGNYFGSANSFVIFVSNKAMVDINLVGMVI